MSALAEHMPHTIGQWNAPRLVGYWHRFSVLRRHWRLRRFRRRRLACILAQVRDPKLLADIGIGPLPKTGLEGWASSLVPHR